MYDLSKYSLVTSNQNKLAEYHSYGLGDLKCVKGDDLAEIEHTDPYLVAAYKAKDAGPFRIVEDTSLEVDGVAIGTNVKWLLNDLGRYIDKSCEWIVTIALNNSEEVVIFEGRVRGTLTNHGYDAQSVFGFNGHFRTESGLTLHELYLKGRLDDYSARKIAEKQCNTASAYQKV